MHLKLQDGTYSSDTALANLGLYGLGKRRSLKQLETFTKMDLVALRGNEGDADSCVNLEYIPFDASISPVDNFYDEPDDLDPQPEFPLRTKTIFYEQIFVKQAPRHIAVDLNAGYVHQVMRAQNVDSFQRMDGVEQPNLPPFTTLVVLWVFGMVVWCVMFMSPGSNNGSAKKKKIKQTMYKDV